MSKGDLVLLHISQVLGSRLEPAFAEQLHDLAHRAAIDIVTISTDDLNRRRLRIATRSGEELAIALPREQKLFDGAVLLIDGDRAIVVRAATERWLKLEPHSVSDAIELGYHAGNLHWRVRFDGNALLVALEGRPEDYIARLADMVATQKVVVSIVDEADSGDAHHPHSHDTHHHHHDHQAP